MQENSYYRVSIKALILSEEKKFLLFREENGKWDLPGGGLDYGEDPQTCLKRELAEEAGLIVTGIKEHPSYFVTGLFNGTQWKANILYETAVKDLHFTPSEECVEVRFFTKEEALREQLHQTVLAFIREFNPENHR